MRLLSSLKKPHKLQSDEVRIKIKGKIDLDGIIHGADLPKDKPGIIICHGVGVFQSLYVDFARYLVKHGGYRVLTFNFRGHGRNQEHKLTLDGALEDVENAVKYMTEKQGHKNIILIGHSLGAVMSLKYTSKIKPNTVKALVLIGCPTNFESVKRRAFMIFFFAKSFLANLDVSEIYKHLADYNSEKDIKNLENVPVCTVYGHFDEFVKYFFHQRFDKLKEMAKKTKVDVKEMQQMDHMTTFIKEEYKKDILDWINEHVD